MHLHILHHAGATDSKHAESVRRILHAYVANSAAVVERGASAVWSGLDRRFEAPASAAARARWTGGHAMVKRRVAENCQSLPAPGLANIVLTRQDDRLQRRADHLHLRGALHNNRNAKRCFDDGACADLQDGTVSETNRTVERNARASRPDQATRQHGHDVSRADMNRAGWARAVRTRRQHHCAQYDQNGCDGATCEPRPRTWNTLCEHRMKFGGEGRHRSELPQTRQRRAYRCVVTRNKTAARLGSTFDRVTGRLRVRHSRGRLGRTTGRIATVKAA
jgi:hypothetical protein